AIVSVNEGTFDEVVLKLQKRIGSLKGKRVGVLGLTYKPGTSTMRRSPAIKIIQKLRKAGATCVGYDPAAGDDQIREYKNMFVRAATAEDLAAGAHALVLVTEWPEFKQLDFASLGEKMKKRVIVDSKNHLDPAALHAAGFTYQGFGRAS